MTIDNNKVAGRIRAGLLKLSSQDAQYWEFRRQARREGLHGLIQYPAMMVPRMQGDVLDTILAANPAIKSIWDPFVGAGTTLTESMLRGRDFLGHDINPLAVLTCEAKSEMFRADLLEKKVVALLKCIANDSSSNIEVNFPGRDKWFTHRASQSISKVRRSIMRERAKWARKIMWISLCEAIRKTSNSRTSTYKLHERPKSDQNILALPEKIFTEELQMSVDRFRFHQSLLESRGLIDAGRYKGNVRVKCTDTREAKRIGLASVDLIITSPPYGDNRSTVPYGQFSYLPLNWIPEDDLPGSPSIFFNTQSTDYRSLGGSIHGFENKAHHLIGRSKIFKEFHQSLSQLGRRDLSAKVTSFVFDFEHSLSSICARLRPGGLAVWTLGNRTVGGIAVPLDEICREFQEQQGLKHITTVRRKIPCKRSPNRNAISSTMGDELLLVMEKPEASHKNHYVREKT